MRQMGARLLAKGASIAAAFALSAVLLAACDGALAGPPPSASRAEGDRGAEAKPLTVDTFREGQVFDFLYIYDSDYLDMAFEPHDVTLDELHAAIDANGGIPESYHGILHEYCAVVVGRYPDIDLRPFLGNLEGLEIVELAPQDFEQRVESPSSYGAYAKRENVIYLRDNLRLPQGRIFSEWGRQVVFHELSHCLRGSCFENGETEVHIDFEGRNSRYGIVTEAVNTLFSMELLGYGDGELAYDFQATCIGVMLDCMDNYSLSDYANHSQSYLASKLDECNGDVDCATEVFELLQRQYDETREEGARYEAGEFSPIYDYLCKMYYRGRVTPDMTYDEARGVAEELHSRIPLSGIRVYDMDSQRFYDDLDLYYRAVKAIDRWS